MCLASTFAILKRTEWEDSEGCKDWKQSTSDGYHTQSHLYYVFLNHANKTKLEQAGQKEISMKHDAES